jgi:hypothetical protein
MRRRDLRQRRGRDQDESDYGQPGFQQRLREDSHWIKVQHWVIGLADARTIADRAEPITCDTRDRPIRDAWRSAPPRLARAVIFANTRIEYLDTGQAGRFRPDRWK